MKSSKNYFLHLITKLIPTIIILTTVTANYSSVIANDKSPVLQSNQTTFKPSETINTEQIKQVAKQQNATILQYSIIPDESELYIWVIKPTGDIQFRQVDLKAWEKIEKNSFFNLFRRDKRRFSARSTATKGIIIKPVSKEKTSLPDLQKLHQVLIKPIADLLPNTSNEPLIFIPQGELFSVPFAALQDEEGKYLIEKNTISTAPSIQALDLLYQRKNKAKGQQSFNPKSITGNEILIVGNPTAPKTPLKTGEEICKVPPLPGAEKEAKNIAQLFNTQALIGDAATETAIVKKIPQARIIHLATYTLPNDCHKENSLGVIALASSEQDDGWLKTEEIQNLKLKADLVVLTGCDTALGKITGDGVIGLSRAFLGAGADSVIGSLWEVDDIKTTFIITEFYGNLSRNTDKAGALRQATLETMKKYPNPQDWAAFTLVGLL